MSRLFDSCIEASHPEMSASPDRFCADEVAMRLVEGRDSKREIVNMVRWLIMDKAETVRYFMMERNKRKECCGSCKSFEHEDMNGYGYCGIERNYCGDGCDDWEARK